LTRADAESEVVLPRVELVPRLPEEGAGNSGTRVAKVWWIERFDENGIAEVVPQELSQ
jgi:hypothetical protein